MRRSAKFMTCLDKTGLLPSTEVEHWVRRQVNELDAGPFRATVHVHG